MTPSGTAVFSGAVAVLSGAVAVFSGAMAVPSGVSAAVDVTFGATAGFLDTGAVSAGLGFNCDAKSFSDILGLLLSSMYVLVFLHYPFQ